MLRSMSSAVQGPFHTQVDEVHLCPGQSRSMSSAFWGPFFAQVDMFSYLRSISCPGRWVTQANDRFGEGFEPSSMSSNWAQKPSSIDHRPGRKKWQNPTSVFVALMRKQQKTRPSRLDYFITFQAHLAWLFYNQSFKNLNVVFLSKWPLMIKVCWHLKCPVAILSTC